MVGEPFQRYGIVGQSRAVADVIRRIELVSATRSTVLISGETGTGKVLTREAVTVDATMSVRTDGVRSLKLRQNVEWIECETIRRALDMSTVKRQAARLMGISPQALSHYLAKYPFIDQIRAQP